MFGAEFLAFFGGEAGLGSYEALALKDDPTNRLDGGERRAVDKSSDCVGLGEVGLGSDVHGKANELRLIVNNVQPASHNPAAHAPRYGFLPFSLPPHF